MGHRWRNEGRRHYGFLRCKSAFWASASYYSSGWYGRVVIDFEPIDILTTRFERAYQMAEHYFALSVFYFSIQRPARAMLTTHSNGHAEPLLPAKNTIRENNHRRTLGNIYLCSSSCPVSMIDIIWYNHKIWNASHGNRLPSENFPALASSNKNMEADSGIDDI